MKKRILTFIIVLASVFMLASCEQKDQSEALTGQTVTLRLSGVEIPGARTIRPDTVKSAESYTVSLTEVSMNESGSYVPVQGSQNNKININATVSTDGSALTLTITDVHIGSYLVTVNQKTVLRLLSLLLAGTLSQSRWSRSIALKEVSTSQEPYQYRLTGPQ